MAEQSDDKIPFNYLDTVMYVDPITRQTIEYKDPPLLFENNVKTTHKMLLP